jgi:major vault protein
VQQNLALAGEQRRLTFVQASEAVQREVALAQSTSRQAEVELQIAEAEKQLALRLAGVQSELEAAQLRLEHQQQEQALRNQIHLQELERKRQSLDLDLSVARQQLDQRLTLLNSEVQATVAKAEAVSPDLIAALQAFGDKALAERMAETMAPLAILGGTSVVDALGNLLRGTRLEEVLLRSQGLLPGDPNK